MVSCASKWQQTEVERLRREEVHAVSSGWIWCKRGNGCSGSMWIVLGSKQPAFAATSFQMIQRARM